MVPTGSVEKNYSLAKKINIDGTSNLINALIKHHKKKKKFEMVFLFFNFTCI